MSSPYDHSVLSHVALRPVHSNTSLTVALYADYSCIYTADRTKAMHIERNGSSYEILKMD